MKKIAFVTQSYKNDYNECKLLCESMDRFAPDYEHFIFVNDEDEKLFQTLQYGKHVVYRKGLILPWYLFRLPVKIAGHFFHVSLFTLPVREWIVQQICKLGVFDVIGDEYDASFNIDSETVLMKRLDINKWIDANGNFMMFKNIKDDEPSKDDYYKSIKKFFKIPDDDFEILNKWNYMSTPVCFEKNNIKEMLAKIEDGTLFGGWKRALCNTYRFSEYYTYGVFVDHYLKCRNHFLTDIHFFPQIDVGWCSCYDEFVEKMNSLMKSENSLGLWLQKGSRKTNEKNYLDFNEIKKAVYDYWEQQG